MTVRVASWNLQGRSGDAAARLGSLLADRGGADLVLLQEASHRGLGRFCEAAGLDWGVHIREVFPDLLRVRGRAGGRGSDGSMHGVPRAVAIAGRGETLNGATSFPDVPLPEKVLAGWLDVGDVRTTVVSYHAPTGVQHQGRKPEQAVRLARWLRDLDGPVILAGDFNTPSLDPPDFDRVRTHWHTGDAHLEGAPGDDLLVGPEPIHSLRDALRTYLSDRPEELDAIRARRPEGPLEVSHRTGEGDHNRYRYDAIWLSPEFEVSSVAYHYDDACEAGTDHALVLVDAAIRTDLGGEA
jgi:endonuclease/exonuclease/phosphatase family metal-dependent hydrolase